MPITLTKIANNVSSVSFRYNDETVHVDYYPSKITEKTFAELQAFSQMNEENISSTFESFNALLASLIKSWDVYEDDEEQVMFPLDPERLAELPIVFRSLVLQAIMQDIRPETMTAQMKS